jgi:stage II sporulation protein M
MGNKKIKTTKKENFLLRNLKQSWNYILESKKYLSYIFWIFLVFILIGALFPAPDLIVRRIQELIKSLMERTQGLNTLELIFFIFKNNLTVSFFGIILGIVFGIVPIIFAVSNGYVIGYVIKSVIVKLGVLNGVLSLWRLFPHGIFELPAVLISLGLGLRLGSLLIHSLNYHSFKNFVTNIKLIFKVILFIILPLLLIAAIIEGSLMRIMG